MNLIRLKKAEDIKRIRCMSSFSQVWLACLDLASLNKDAAVLKNAATKAF